MTIWPKREKVTPVLTTIRPVTHTADVAVKAASTNPSVSRSTVATGKVRSSAPSKMTQRKPMARIWTGLRACIFFSSHCLMLGYPPRQNTGSSTCRLIFPAHYSMGVIKKQGEGALFPLIPERPPFRGRRPSERPPGRRGRTMPQFPGEHVPLPSRRPLPADPRSRQTASVRRLCDPAGMVCSRFRPPAVLFFRLESGRISGIIEKSDRRHSI